MTDTQLEQMLYDECWVSHLDARELVGILLAGMTVEAAHRWLTHPQEMLDGEVPLDLLALGRPNSTRVFRAARLIKVGEGALRA